MRAVMTAVVAVLAFGVAAGGPARTLTRAVLEDKIRGGWAGKMIGVSYGAPTEFRWNGRINDGELTWSPERVSNALNQDDLYVGMTMAETMERLGFEATTEQYGEAFKDSQYDLWHANAAARRLLDLGIKAPLSGHPRYNLHANDIDFQIEADFIGLMSPGLPRESNTYCLRVGRVMNYGDGLYGGLFISGMYTAAYFETDVRKVVEQGLACLPPESGFARLIRDVLAWSAEHPADWTRTWQRIADTWDRDESCPDGALRPFNIDARINAAYVALGLLYGRGDFARTVDIATRAGQDSDCNPSTAAGILGVMLGYSGIPEAFQPWPARSSPTRSRRSMTSAAPRSGARSASCRWPAERWRETLSRYPSRSRRPRRWSSGAWAYPRPAWAWRIRRGGSRDSPGAPGRRGLTRRRA